MKYISVVILVWLLSWTWCLATAERPLSMEQHKHVEAGVEQDVRNFIQKRYPAVSEVFCQQLYTEDVDPGLELIAHFRCQAVGEKDTENASEQVFEGYLRLYSNDGFATWGETGGEINAKEISFLNGFKITPDASRDNGTPDSK
jgi:hypothetical protein